MPEYQVPDFSREPLVSSPDARFAPAPAEGVAPDGFHATSIFPEYVKHDGEWKLVEGSRMDCVITLDGENFAVKEFRCLKPGEMVAVGRKDDGTEGIFVHPDGFPEQKERTEAFAFRIGRTRESSYSMDYDTLYELLKHDKENGYIVWVAGPAMVFDHDSRRSMEKLVERGYVHALFTGNALAVHDLEASLFRTALGQDIYNQRTSLGGHYNHLEVINRARRHGSIAEFLRNENVEDGIIKACHEAGVPVVIGGSIRDDGPLPDAMTDAIEAQDEMRKHTRKATTLICLATQLHSIAAGNMTPSYQVIGGRVRPVFIYVVDVSEFAAGKLRDRGSLAVRSIITNVQDFLVNLERGLA